MIRTTKECKYEIPNRFRFRWWSHGYCAGRDEETIGCVFWDTTNVSPDVISKTELCEDCGHGGRWTGADDDDFDIPSGELGVGEIPPFKS
jgi:hypothetical protein